MKAYEAMTKDVVTVGANTPVREIAALLVRHRISAVPVVSEGGRVIGIVSQTDLGHRDSEHHSCGQQEGLAHPAPGQA